MSKVLKVSNASFYGDYYKIWGNKNTIMGENSLIVGNNNIVSGNNLIIYGNYNFVMGYHTSVYGVDNIINGYDIKEFPPKMFPPLYEDHEIKDDHKYSHLINTGTTLYRNIINDNTFSMLTLEGNSTKADEDIKDMYRCIICMDNLKNVMLNPCSHIVFCVECARNDKLSHKCPICRKNYKSAQIIYF